jgi:hypothetical protein
MQLLPLPNFGSNFTIGYFCFGVVFRLYLVTSRRILNRWDLEGSSRDENKVLTKYLRAGT